MTKKCNLSFREGSQTLTKAKQPKISALRNIEYYDYQDVLDSLYSDSTQSKQFNNLLGLVTSPENIKLAYRNIKKNHGSKTAGVDKKTITHLEKWVTEKLIGYVQKRLDYYVPQPVRRVEIPKGGGKTRPLGIPTIMDRLIQQCILQVLEPICEAKFFKRSNGFRPNRGAEHAISQAYKFMQGQNLHFVVDIDIKGFFDNVNHGKLLKQMWTMGIRDKKLLKIISVMLKAEVASIGFPEKGTPQGGIISPLLSNIVLNELDWWVASQWEIMPTRYPYRCRVMKNGTRDKSNVYAELRNTELKECYIVRYADDFKIFCRKRSDAQKIFTATQLWLKDRLGLDISPEKSKIVNLKKHYSEFLGFKMKVIQKGKKTNGQKKYAVRSHMSDKAKEKCKEKAVAAVKELKRLPNATQARNSIVRYNSLVLGWHNYYRLATHISKDFREIAFLVKNAIKGKLERQLKKSISTPIKSPVYLHYAKSKEVRYIGGTPIIPVAYVQHKNPIDKKRSINKYTATGRAEIHKRLEMVNMGILHYLMRNPVEGSVEYNDNRLSIYCAQQGKCAVLNLPLEIDRIHCHHKKPKSQGGGDNYQNLTIVDELVHILIHATKSDTVEMYKGLLNLTAKQLGKLNKLREIAGLGAI